MAEIHCCLTDQPTISTFVVSLPLWVIKSAINSFLACRWWSVPKNKAKTYLTVKLFLFTHHNSSGKGFSHICTTPLSTFSFISLSTEPHEIRVLLWNITFRWLLLFAEWTGMEVLQISHFALNFRDVMWRDGSWGNVWYLVGFVNYKFHAASFSTLSIMLAR